MNAILFRVRKELKNQLKNLLHHPEKLILYLFLVVIIGFSFVSNLQSSAQRSAAGKGYMDIRILCGVYLGVLVFLFVATLLSGLSKGTTFFSMCDVNVLFVSPLSPRKILIYGLVKQMGRSLLMVVFLLCYGAMMADMFGLAMWQTALLMVGVAVDLFAAQVFAMLVYCLVNGRPTVSRMATLVIYVFTALPVLAVLLLYLRGDSTKEALLDAVSSSVLQWLPLVGWIKGAVFGAVNANAQAALLFGGLAVASIAGALILFSKANIDYYEDVLDSTERVDQRRTAIKENRTSAFSFSQKKIKLHKTGLNGGWGASAFFYKHLCEMRRKSRLPFLDGFTLLTVGLNIAVGMFINKSVTFTGFGSNKPLSMIMFACLCMDCYLLFFANMSGAWTREMEKHYVFIVPESSFSKLIWSSMTTVLKPVVDGVLAFTLPGLIFHADALFIVTCILVYSSVGLLYLSLNVLAQRTMGQMANKGLIMLVYMVILVLLAAPGIVGSVVVLAASGATAMPILVALPVILWNILVSLVVIALCRNVMEVGLK